MMHKNMIIEESVIADLPSPVMHKIDFGQNLPFTGAGVKVAIVDTGKPDHADIHNEKGFINFADSHTVSDTMGESTIAAGIIGANNPQKIVGIAPECEMYFAKISRDDGTVSVESFMAALLWTAIKNVDIVVLPMTMDMDSAIFHDAVKKLFKANIPVVCFAGAYGYPQYPSSYPEVLSVGATSHNGKRAGFSQEGKINVIGTSITSTYLNQKYCVASGGVCATAVAAGITALVIEQTKKAKTTVEVMGIYNTVGKLLQNQQRVEDTNVV